ncbi:ArsR/SmtB family transcription factor [Agathobacter sp. LCP21S3_B2]|uniref:ArsR/SmtB family transcription factor n=1 Tax=Agathobacter sp. LCP21S3_B2 TaxID=3438734 RepID=UPI003F92C678
MIHITSLDDGLELFKALGSDIRIQILKILLENNQMSMNQLANELNISNGALTGHIKKLEECGLISTSNDSSGHGNQKLCSLIQDRILVEIEKPIDLSNVYNTSIKVGQFSSHNVCPTCGMATSLFVIGELDDVRYFDHPDRFNADIMWFTKGYVEYVIPNLIPRNQKITQLSLSAEISSEAPGIDNNWPSDISFYINDTLVGTWTSPGDYGDVRGMFTPEWWPQNWNQYGLLKLLVINHKGTFIDGLKISDVTTSELNLDYTSTIRFRIAVEEDSAHIGGLTIFGKSFGNYDQDIVVSINYAPLDAEKTTK